jgi:hypothetical protein
VRSSADRVSGWPCARAPSPLGRGRRGLALRASGRAPASRSSVSHDPDFVIVGEIAEHARQLWECCGSLSKRSSRRMASAARRGLVECVISSSPVRIIGFEPEPVGPGFSAAERSIHAVYRHG